jgi:hypothetical protein
MAPKYIADQQRIHHFANRSLKVDSCAQQHISGRVCARRLPKRSVLQLRIHRHQVHPVEEVEYIKPQLQAGALRESPSRCIY